MSNLAQAYIISGLFLVMLCLVFVWLVVGILRKNKGSAALLLTDKTHNLGESVTGELAITARRSIDLTSVQLDLTVDYLAWSPRMNHHSHRVFTRRTNQKERRRIPAGKTHKVPFRLDLPSAALNQPDEEKLAKVMARGERTQWHVIANVDCAGVDLNCRERLVMINIT